MEKERERECVNSSIGWPMPGPSVIVERPSIFIGRCRPGGKANDGSAEHRFRSLVGGGACW